MEQAKVTQTKPIYDMYESLSQYPIQGLRARLLGARALGDREMVQKVETEIASRLPLISPAFPDQKTELENLHRQAEEYLGENHGTKGN